MKRQIARQPTAVIVGMGNNGRRQERAVQQAGGAVVGGCDIDLDHASRMALGYLPRAGLVDPEAYPSVPTVYDSISEMVTETTPDVVIITTWPAAHLNCVEEALDSGAKVILLEKPGGQNLEDALKIARLANEHGAVVAVSMQHRFNGVEARALITGGRALGAVLGVTGTWIRRDSMEVLPPQIITHGVIYDLYPHVGGLATWLAGLEDPGEVSVTFRGIDLKPLERGRPPIWAEGRIMYGSVPFNFRLAWKSPPTPELVTGDEVFHVDVQLTGDTLHMELPFAVETKPAPAELTGGVRAEFEMVSVSEMFVMQMANMFDVARGRAEALVPIEEAVKVHRMMGAIHQAWELGHTVTLDDR